MLIIQYYVPQQITKSISVNEIELVAIYAILQWLIAILFLLIHKRRKKSVCILSGSVIKFIAFARGEIHSALPTRLSSFLFGIILYYVPKSGCDHRYPRWDDRLAPANSISDLLIVLSHHFVGSH